MKIIRFIYKRRINWGILEKDLIRLLKDEPYEKISLTNKRVDFGEIELLAPSKPSKIILAGLNYRDHAEELGLAIPQEPVVFLKPPTSVIAHRENIIYPQGAGRLDYEGELALVIKKEAKNVPQDKVNDYILGYTCLNDVTARDLQKKDGQWTRSKSFDTFCPFGPYLETAINPSCLKIRSYLNGKRVQDSDTSKFIYPVDYLVSFISRIMTLLPGDVISTGTPAGTGPMQPNDKIEVEIEGIGNLINFVTAGNL